MGLMERRDMEDNEPLSRRRDRLQGRPQQIQRAITTIPFRGARSPVEDEETLAQRVRRMKEEGGPSNNLPKARPVSGDFASEMMSQFGGDLLDAKDKGKEISTQPSPEEDNEDEETLGQRRKRLQIEKEAQEKEAVLSKRHSLANLLQAHPSAGASHINSYSKPPTGLLGLQEKAAAQHASSMPNNLDQLRPKAFVVGPVNGNRTGGGIPNSTPQPQHQHQHKIPSNFNTMYNYNQMFPQPSVGYGFGNGQMMPQYTNPYSMPYPNGMQMGYTMPNMAMQNQNAMQMSMMGADFQPLNLAQADMVERWRQSVMH